MFFLKNHPLFCWSPILDRYTILFWQKTLCYLYLISLTKVRPKLCEKKQKNVTPKESNIHSSWLKVALYVIRTGTYMKFWKIQGGQSPPWIVFKHVWNCEWLADLLHKFTTFPFIRYFLCDWSSFQNENDEKQLSRFQFQFPRLLMCPFFKKKLKFHHPKLAILGWWNMFNWTAFHPNPTHSYALFRIKYFFYSLSFLNSVVYMVD